MRKRICVILIGLHAVYTDYLISGISDQAHALGYDVDVYSYFGLRTLDDGFMNGEANILNLIAPENYDAFITHKTLIEEKHIRDQIDEICRSSGKPYLDVEDEESAETDYPMWNDREKFRRLTEHFITVHRHRKIYCITGHKGFHQSENRLLGYRDAMRAHGIEPEPDWEYYGDYWKHYTKAFADKLASGEIPMPEAVVCAATAPAITLIERLREHGIQVPRDLAVAGYDFAFEGEMCEPTITSISFPHYNNGIKAACRIHKMMTGKLVKSVPFREEGIRIGASCGCHVMQGNLIKYFKDIMLARLEYRELFHNSGFQENISKAENTDDFFGKLKDLNYVIRGIKTVHYFLCDDWNGINNVKDGTYRKKGYSDDLLTYTFSREPDNMAFSITKLTEFLQIVKSEKQPSTHFFFPMHYVDRVFGFAALNFKENRFTPDELFRDYLATFNNALEALRIRQYITRFSERINLAVIRDPLTGTYNRRGFEELSAEIYENAVIHGECFMIIVVKLYNLSEINHSIGYSEADRLLVQLAEILNEGCRGNEVCCHVRADTFYIVGSHHTSSRERSAYVKKISDFFGKRFPELEAQYGASVDMEIYYDHIDEEAKLSDIISQIDAKLSKKHLNRQKHLYHMSSINQLRKAIYDDPERKWTIDEMAKMMLLSKAYFQRMYKRTFQITVSADIINARIEKAKRLLSEGTTIIETAELCGYSSDVYFMHQFKKETGMTPSEWVSRK